MKFQDWSIGTKLAASVFALVGGIFLTFLFFVSYSSSQSAEKQAMQEVADKTRIVANSVEILDKDLRHQVAIFAKLFRSNFRENFSIDASRKTELGGKSAPMLLNGGTEINLDFSIPDRFTELTGVYATVFVRKDDDFIRITTSHKNESGQRAIGTMLDHAHPAYRLILEGKSYAGTASLFGGQYMTQYDPIKDLQGTVIGAIYVGVDFTESMRSLSDELKSIKLGQSGVYFALNAKEGKDYGTLLIHPSNEGSNVLGLKDANGFEYIKAMLTQKQGAFHYKENAKGSGSPRERLVAFTHIKSWNMIVSGDAYLDEITADAIRLRNRYALIGLIMITAIAGLLYPVIRKMVVNPLNRALEVAEAVARGDLTSRIEAKTADETGRLMRAMQKMNDSLAEIVGKVRAGTEVIATASSEISSGNMDLSSRTEQQAASLEETASSMEELTSTVRQNADNAMQANQLALSASEVALKGGKTVSQVVRTMESINESAKKIADIISVIDSIAFQTNILALNAAVEAARAGEQGKGFAVVATEVRNLAQRSAAAAKEIKDLIVDSVNKVDSGGKQVNEAGHTMQEIVEAIQRVTSIMNEISSASREQTTGIEQVNQAIIQMDATTQQNASLVEEAAAASQSLRDQATNMSRLVRVFRLN